jgi:orotate phosphoribosyltransferase
VDLSRVLQRPLLLARTQPKAYGTLARIEGVPVPGHRALLVDDVVRSGRQMAEVAAALRDSGLTVTDASCVLLRSPAGLRLLQEHGIRLQSLLPPSFARGDDDQARAVEKTG